MTDDDVDVRENPELSRYEIWVDATLAGFAEYHLHGTAADFTHTEIGDAFEGRGLGSRLIGASLDAARNREWQVLPYCPFVQAFIGKHPDYVELVPADRRPQFDL